MSELTPEIVADLVAACQAGLPEINEALSRTLELTLETQVGKPGNFDEKESAEQFAGPGLLVVIRVGSSAALLALPESSGLLPEWYARSDATSQSKLTTLAQELGMLVLPETLMAEDFRAQRVESIQEVLQQSEVAATAQLLPLELSATDKSGTASLIWPASPADAAFDATEKDKLDEAKQEEARAEANSVKECQPTTAASAKTLRPSSLSSISVNDLPAFAQTLLRVKVPVMVKLAAKKTSTREVLELAPGAIVQFEKSCEEMLDVEVAGHRIGRGEAVKVGDKFGLRITSIILPEERFKNIQGKKR